MSTKSQRVEFGDFQTPPVFAGEVVNFLKNGGVRPDVIVEPTCGRGAFVVAACHAFPKARVLGFELNGDYVRELMTDLHGGNLSAVVRIQDFFRADWAAIFSALPGFILVLGNPPWVTNSAMSVLGGLNLPEKANLQGDTGFAAKTGKANFDISEWMMIRLLEALRNRTGCLAMLCKTSAARKTLRYVWRNGLNLADCELRRFDAKSVFNVSVDACLLLVRTGSRSPLPVARVYDSLTSKTPVSTLGLVGADLVADFTAYQRVRQLDGGSPCHWRSGVKHDAASVMEFTKEGDGYRNALGEHVVLEDNLLYPLLKSSDLANGRLDTGRFVLITQKAPGDDTMRMKVDAPKVWNYLVGHGDLLDGRKSVIYRKRPRFAIFGVGPYSFASWKVAVSGLYKNFRFEIVGPCQGRPVMLDDTCYFLPCTTQDEAESLRALLDSDECRQFLKAVVFSDAKRPLTVDVLNRINLVALARLQKPAARLPFAFSEPSYPDEPVQQLMVMEGSASTYRQSRSVKGRKDVRASRKDYASQI